MIQIDNHWNYGKEYRDHMTAPEVEPDIPKWTELQWEKGDLIDFDLDERETYHIMTAECNGVKYEGTGTFVHDTLEIVDNIEIVQ